MELYIILIFMIIGAIIAVEIKDLLSAIVADGVVGLGLSVAFLILKAPDLAIVQLVVEILALVILLRATINRDVDKQQPKVKIISLLLCFCFVGLFLVCSYKCLMSLPQFGYPIMKVAETYIREGIQSTGAANLVSAIILDYRGYDTLGEATILFTAVIGALAVLRATGRKKKAE